MEIEKINTDVANTNVSREEILSLEESLSKIQYATFGDNENMPLKHSFAPGMYVREIFIPKGSILTGKIHRHDHPNFLMSGEVIVLTEFGGREHLKAPLSMISKAGTKRAVLALEDTTWITVHATDETDLKKIEEYVIAPSYDDLNNVIEKTQIESEIETKNCLILELKALGRDYKCLLELEPQGTDLPFKKSLEKLKENGISTNAISATKLEDGKYHAHAGQNSLYDLELTDDDLIGSWVATAVAGSAIIGGTTSYLAGRSQAGATRSAAEMQLQAARESIAAQQKYADKGFDIYRSENALARKDLEPFRKVGLESLKIAQGFTDPNSPLAQQERDAFGSTLTNTLSARGLTASGTEISGLSDFELGLARERRNLALGLAGQGANTLESLSALHTGLGSTGASIYGNLGSGIGQSLLASGNNQANLLLAGNQASTQGFIGASNAFQTGLLGLGQLSQNRSAQANQNAQFSQIMSLYGGGGGGSQPGLLSLPNSGGLYPGVHLNYNNPFTQ